ncbi:MAG: hypothetical protein HY785_04250 [Oscillatoriophycideae cyanobacterium NC_groundwater_1537_Pr4_S-0.65um_50_18]|nr:hypothetical protein [Oscillatoriophycideae cyanobacterium NC_groundwater_1537_Pr4_S-0.65um_50_18]
MGESLFNFVVSDRLNIKAFGENARLILHLCPTVSLLPDGVGIEPENLHLYQLIRLRSNG